MDTILRERDRSMQRSDKMIQSGIETDEARGFEKRIKFGRGFSAEPQIMIGLCGIQSTVLGFLATADEATFTETEFTLTVQTFASSGINSAKVSWIAYGTSQGAERMRSGVQPCAAQGPEMRTPYRIEHGLGCTPSGVVLVLSAIDSPAGREDCHLFTTGLTRNGFTLHLDLPVLRDPPNGVSSVSAVWLAHSAEGGSRGAA
jgi:hypothetical protein